MTEKHSCTRQVTVAGKHLCTGQVNVTGKQLCIKGMTDDGTLLSTKDFATKPRIIPAHACMCIGKI